MLNPLTSNYQGFLHWFFNFIIFDFTLVNSRERRFSTWCFLTNIEEVGYHEASNDDFIEENIDEQNIDKVQFSTQHDEF